VSFNAPVSAPRLNFWPVSPNDTTSVAFVVLMVSPFVIVTVDRLLKVVATKVKGFVTVIAASPYVSAAMEIVPPDAVLVMAVAIVLYGLIAVPVPTRSSPLVLFTYVCANEATLSTIKRTTVNALSKTSLFVFICSSE